jgi:hypothetical protein
MRQGLRRRIAQASKLTALCIAMFGAVEARAQGGPPMLTDDPETIEAGHWEINLARTSERSAHAHEDEAPLADINYGLIEGVQLKFEMPWVAASGNGNNGFGDALVGVKWRFVDRNGWQVSTYPQIGFLPPGLHHTSSVDAGVSHLLPIEVQRDFGGFDAGAEIGRSFGPSGGEDGWIAGITIGGKLSERFELIGELHDETSGDVDTHELVLNVGARQLLSEHFTLLMSLGSDIENTIGPRNRWVSYLGLQVQL